MARRAAALLSAPWHDLDDVVTQAAGSASVAEIFAERGEPAFRRLEQASMLGVLAGPPAVIAAGGGWAAQPGNLAAAEAGALTIYLSLDPAVAATRLRDTADRPLLAGDTASRLHSLFAEREQWYRLAGIEIAADRSPELVASAVATAARQYAGW